MPVENRRGSSHIEFRVKKMHALAGFECVSSAIYSTRNVAIGSSFVARRTGTHATRATVPIMRADTASNPTSSAVSRTTLLARGDRYQAKARTSTPAPRDESRIGAPPLAAGTAVWTVEPMMAEKSCRPRQDPRPSSFSDRECRASFQRARAASMTGASGAAPSR